MTLKGYIIVSAIALAYDAVGAYIEIILALAESSVQSDRYYLTVFGDESVAFDYPTVAAGIRQDVAILYAIGVALILKYYGDFLSYYLIA